MNLFASALHPHSEQISSLRYGPNRETFFATQRNFLDITSASRRSVGIDAALDLGDPFLVADDHRGDGDRASY